MTFDEFLGKVFEDFMIGGVTWSQAYMRTLRRELPEMAGIVEADPNINPETSPFGFIFYARSTWGRYPVTTPKSKPA